jgi:AcrR family transcriptional regulator
VALDMNPAPAPPSPEPAEPVDLPPSPPARQVGAAARPGPRERLLKAARDLTYARGFAVGVAAILEEADVARRSLYQHFGGKDQLVAEVVRESAADTEREYAAALAGAGPDPRARLLAIFDMLDSRVADAGFRGCHFLSAELTLPSPDHPARVESRAHKRRVCAMFERELTELGHPVPPHAARQLQLLVDGVLVVGATHPDTHPARAARPLAAHILDTHGEC